MPFYNGKLTAAEQVIAWMCRKDFCRVSADGVVMEFGLRTHTGASRRLSECVKKGWVEPVAERGMYAITAKGVRAGERLLEGQAAKSEVA